MQQPQLLGQSQDMKVLLYQEACSYSILSLWSMQLQKIMLALLSGRHLQCCDHCMWKSWKLANGHGVPRLHASQPPCWWFWWNLWNGRPFVDVELLLFCPLTVGPFFDSARLLFAVPADTVSWSAAISACEKADRDTDYTPATHTVIHTHTHAHLVAVNVNQNVA